MIIVAHRMIAELFIFFSFLNEIKLGTEVCCVLWRAQVLIGCLFVNDGGVLVR